LSCFLNVRFKKSTFYFINQSVFLFAQKRLKKKNKKMINNFFEPHVLQMFKQQQTLWQPLINVVRTEHQEEQDPFMISSIGCTITNNNQPNNNRINQIHYFVVTNLADVHFFAKISDQELYQQNALGCGFTPAPGMFGNLFRSCLQNQHRTTSSAVVPKTGDVYACELRLSKSPTSSSLLFSIQLAMGDDDLNPPVQVQLKVPLMSMCDDPRFVREWFLRPLLKQLHSVKVVAAVGFEQVCAAKSASSSQNLGQFQQQVLDNLPNSLNNPNNNNNNNIAISLAKNLVNQPVSLLISDRDSAQKTTLEMLLDSKQTHQGQLFCINKICDAVEQELQNQERYVHQQHQQDTFAPIVDQQNHQHVFSGESTTTNQHQQNNNNRQKNNKKKSDDDDDDEAFFFAPRRGNNNNNDQNNNNMMMMMGGNNNKNHINNNDDDITLDEKARRIVEEAEQEEETEEARKKREAKEQREKLREHNLKLQRLNVKIKAQRRDRF
jgi:hypothetical protein